MAKRVDESGWVIATAIQVVPAIAILMGLPFTPNSPRWLINKDRPDEALAVLKLLRKKEDVANGLCEFELAALREEGHVTQKKEPWVALFNRKNRRRTG